MKRIPEHSLHVVKTDSAKYILKRKKGDFRIMNNLRKSSNTQRPNVTVGLLEFPID